MCKSPLIKGTHSRWASIVARAYAKQSGEKDGTEAREVLALHIRVPVV